MCCVDSYTCLWNAHCAGVLWIQSSQGQRNYLPCRDAKLSGDDRYKHRHQMETPEAAGSQGGREAGCGGTPQSRARGTQEVLKRAKFKKYALVLPSVSLGSVTGNFLAPACLRTNFVALSHSPGRETSTGLSGLTQRLLRSWKRSSCRLPHVGMCCCKRGMLQQ